VQRVKRLRRLEPEASTNISPAVEPGFFRDGFVTLLSYLKKMTFMVYIIKNKCYLKIT
jgi:hypothetical protein